MHAHHWLGWLAVNLALLWLGVEMSLPPAEPVAMAAFDDAYLVPTEFQVATVRGAPSRHPVPARNRSMGTTLGPATTSTKITR